MPYGGVIVMRLGEGQSIVNFTKVEHADETADNELNPAEEAEAVEAETAQNSEATAQPTQE